MTKRELHRKISLLIFLPLTVIVLSGFVLQLRNQFEWIQPSTVNGRPGRVDEISYSNLLSDLKIDSKMVEQMVYRPAKNNLSLRLMNGEEIQIDATSGKILKRAPRRTNFLIELHQGSIFGPIGHYGIYLMSAIGLIALMVTGGMLLFPKKAKT